MNEQSAYDNDLNRQFQNLPLPDENRSWRKMEAMLDEEDNKRGIIPFLLNNAVWIILSLIITAGTWYLLKDHAAVKQQEEITAAKTDKNPVENSTTNFGNTSPNDPATSSSKKPFNSTNNDAVASNPITKSSRDAGNNIYAQAHTSTPVAQEGTFKKTVANGLSHSGINKNEGDAQAKTQEKDNNAATNIAETTNISDQTEATTAASSNPDFTLATKKDQPGEQIASSLTATSILAADTLPNATISHSLPDSSVASLRVNTKTRLTNQLLVSAGIGEQQQIPIAGQSTPRYNDKGKDNIFKDYIPSVYLQLKYGKWFVNTSFKYAGAQYVTKNSFNQQTQFNPATKTTVQKSSSIQKIYYHQLPMTLNYEMAPNWSVGAGIAFNWLHSSIIQNKITVSDAATNNLISENMEVRAIKAFTDSFFYRSPLSALLQTEYKFNRLSLGVRYSWGLQPFMKYTMPDGIIRSQNSQSLQFILRFKLWQTPIKKSQEHVLRTPD